jgi:hypothetical protein
MNEISTQLSSDGSDCFDEIDDSEILLGLRSSCGSLCYKDPEIQGSMLQTPDQLPELPFQEGRQQLTWDLEHLSDGSKWNVIRVEKAILWRQPAFYGSFEEFARVSKIILARYGLAVSDMKPSAASEGYLIGDGFSASSTVERARRALGFKRLPS